jgi:hypothetical protein
MPQVLTTTATITCPHAGMGVTIPTLPYVNAQGGFVTTDGDLGTLSCVFIPPCVGYSLSSMGLNASTIGGRKVILATDFQKSFTGLPLTIVETTNVYDDSTPAPLSPGTSSQPLAPELLDLAPPVVTAVPMAVPFVMSTMLPPTALITFSLGSAFPLSWTLTLLNTTLGTSIDATNGLPTGLVVTPPDGNWTSPSLVVTATMTAAFMASLTPGTHWLYMTGVSKRGISAVAAASVVVS